MDDKKQLYCIVFAVLSRKGSPIKTIFEYMHGESPAQVAGSFRAMHSKAIIRKRIHVIEVALAVGYLALDDHGDQLIA